MPAAASERPVEQCPDCGARLVAGKVAVPVIGTLRFVYRIGTNEIATEVAALMCVDCGLVRLRAPDPEMIRRAQRAVRTARATSVWGRKKWRDAATPPDESPERTS